jgi:hypothetical protein
VEIRRYVVSGRNPDGSIVAAKYGRVERSWEWNGKILCRCAFSDANESAELVAAQADVSLVVFPSESASATVLSTAHQSAVTALDGTIVGKTQITDVIRSIRNGMVAKGHPWFDVSSSF